MNETAKSEMDWACEILSKNQEPMLYLDLIRAIEKKVKMTYDPEAINTVYTAMNLDNRLEYQGAGYWYLTNGRAVNRKEK